MLIFQPVKVLGQPDWLPERPQPFLEDQQPWLVPYVGWLAGTMKPPFPKMKMFLLLLLPKMKKLLRKPIIFEIINLKNFLF